MKTIILVSEYFFASIDIFYLLSPKEKISGSEPKFISNEYYNMLDLFSYFILSYCYEDVCNIDSEKSGNFQIRTAICATMKVRTEHGGFSIMGLKSANTSFFCVEMKSFLFHTDVISVMGVSIGFSLFGPLNRMYSINIHSGGLYYIYLFYSTFRISQDI